MKVGNLISVLLTAVCLAALISFYVSPKLDEQEQPQLRTETTPVPQQPKQSAIYSARRSATLSVRPDGHYWARALVNRRASIEFMVDTGASVVALSLKDAKKMGFKPHELDFKWEIRTAGGITYGASVVIDSIKINQVHIRNVEAMVLQENLDQSLLGMSFLRELDSYEFRGGRMILKQ